MNVVIDAWQYVLNYETVLLEKEPQLSFVEHYFNGLTTVCVLAKDSGLAELKNRYRCLLYTSPSPRDS